MGLWEAYKWIGERAEITWPFPVNERTMPHVYDMVGQLFEPSRRNGPLLIDVLLDAARSPRRRPPPASCSARRRLRPSPSCSPHSRLLQRGLLPYIVASQTIPILAIAPMVVVWLSTKLPESLAGGSRSP